LSGALRGNSMWKQGARAVSPRGAEWPCRREQHRDRSTKVKRTSASESAVATSAMSAISLNR